MDTVKAIAYNQKPLYFSIDNKIDYNMVRVLGLENTGFFLQNIRFLKDTTS